MTISKLSAYGHSFQIKVLSSLLKDKKFLQRINDIITSDYFESAAHKWIINFILQYYSKYNTNPTLDVLHVEVKKEQNDILKISIIEQLKEAYTITADDSDYVQTEFSDFCKNQQLKNALLTSVDLLNTGDYEDIRRLIDNALKAGQEKNIGHEYKKDVETRFRQNERNVIPTPWKAINEITQGGPAGGDLFLIFGGPGGGKSWNLVTVGGYAVKMGYNVLHYTLELAENYVGSRYDAYFTGINVADVLNHREKVEAAIADLEGSVIVKGFTMGKASINTIESHIKQCINDGFDPDLIIIDYLDLLKASRVRKDLKEEIDDVYVAARGLAQEFNKPIWSPSQVNRAGAKDDIIEGDKAAGSYNKIMISDFCMSLSRKRRDKLNGTGRYHIMKNRYGPDGLTFGAKIDTGNGNIVLNDDPYADDGEDEASSNNSSNKKQGQFSSDEKDAIREKFFKLNNAK
jgi:replicative DNA helicase